MKTIFALCFTLVTPFATAQTVEYKQGETTLEGYLATPNKLAAKNPAVLVVHDWKGPGKFSNARADALAKLGFIAFAVDIYGKGVRPQSPKEAGETAGKYKSDRALLRARAEAGLEALKKQKGVDPARIAAIGYCFGGTTVLELARAGADVKRVVSFHGGLSTPTPADAKNIRAKILVLHGADDPNVPDTEVAAFEKEMRDAGVDWELTKYSKAVHSFTNPEAGNDPSKGAAYQAEANRKSWIAMQNFFKDL